jgi:hypothetical protein
MLDMREAINDGLGYLVAALIAFTGRMIALAVVRPPLSWGLLWELPLCIGLGVIGSGIAEHFDLHGHQAAALIAAVAYSGPAGLSAALRVVVRASGAR